MGGSPLGALFNDGMGIITDAQMADQTRRDRNILRDRNRQFGALQDLDPEQLRIKAEQMGIPPQVLASQYRIDQINALRQMQNVASSGGMDNAAINANMKAGAFAARQNQSDNAGIQNKLQMQGMAPGAGAGLAMKQQASQSGYNTVAAAGAQNAANAQMRALKAIQESGRLSGDIASADQARKQQMFNAQFERDRYNTGVRNAANQFNSNANLNTFDRNVGLAGAKVDKANQVVTGAGASRAQQAGYMKDIGNRGQNAMDVMGQMGGGDFDPSKMFGGGKK